jgi:hypothetical protein
MIKITIIYLFSFYLAQFKICQAQKIIFLSYLLRGSLDSGARGGRIAPPPPAPLIRPYKQCLQVSHILDRLSFDYPHFENHIYVLTMSKTNRATTRD